MSDKAFTSLLASAWQKFDGMNSSDIFGHGLLAVFYFDTFLFSCMTEEHHSVAEQSFQDDSQGTTVGE